MDRFLLVRRALVQRHQLICARNPAKMVIGPETLAQLVDRFFPREVPERCGRTDDGLLLGNVVPNIVGPQLVNVDEAVTTTVEDHSTVKTFPPVDGPPYRGIGVVTGHLRREAASASNGIDSVRRRFILLAVWIDKRTMRRFVLVAPNTTTDGKSYGFGIEVETNLPQPGDRSRSTFRRTANSNPPTAVVLGARTIMDRTG